MFISFGRPRRILDFSFTELRDKAARIRSTSMGVGSSSDRGTDARGVANTTEGRKDENGRSLAALASIGHRVLPGAAGNGQRATELRYGTVENFVSTKEMFPSRPTVPTATLYFLPAARNP